MDIGNDGERLVGDDQNWSYYAHLSIYTFAVPSLAGKRVFEAGCGTGYGSAYLMRNGVRELVAADASADAIEHCKARHHDTGIRFETRDLCAPLPYPDASFDAIFSSNVMEHVADIDLFMSECRRILQSDGVMIFAVPPIASPHGLRINVENIWHITHLTTQGWHAKSQRFFDEVQCFAHRHAGKWAETETALAEMRLWPHETVIRETDFEFPNVTVEEMMTGPLVTAVYMLRRPTSQIGARSDLEQLPYDWFPWSIAADVVRQSRATVAPPAAVIVGVPHEDHQALLTERDNLCRQLEDVQRSAVDLQVELERALQHIETAELEVRALRASTSWRVTAPLRALKGG